MNNIFIWLIICLISFVWGGLHYKANYFFEIENKNKYFKFLEYWRHCLNYFISLVIIYYFVSFRWPNIKLNGNISNEDFILSIILFMGIFGWIPYFIKNVTEAINVIFKRILDR